MALYISSTIVSVYPLVPAKISSSNNLIRHLTCVNLHPSSLIHSVFSLSAKPIFAIHLSSSLRATAPQKYVYPDPNPQFAEAETQKFRAELLKRLTKENDEFGDDLENVVNVCAQIFKEFLHKEYGGPGTLMVEPFADMLVALKERKLPGSPLAARTSLLWAQKYVDQDWELWNSKIPK